MQLKKKIRTKKYMNPSSLIIRHIKWLKHATNNNKVNVFIYKIIKKFN